MSKLSLPLMMYGKHRGKLYTETNSKGLFPSENHIFINVYKWDPKLKKQAPTGQRALSKIAENHKEFWKMLALSWKNKNGFRIQSKKKVYLDLYFYFPDKRIRDTHNVNKLLLDAFHNVFFENDYYALPRVQDFQIDKEFPRVEVEVKFYE